MKSRLLVLIVVFSLIQFPVPVRSEVKDEVKYGYFADRTLVANKILILDYELNQRLEQIGRKLIAGSHPKDLNYTFRIINDPTINAFSAAGGFIYVNSGLLDILESEDQVAAVLAHEIVHADKNHQINAVRTAEAAKVGTVTSGILLGAVLGGLAAAGGAAAYRPRSGYNPNSWSAQMARYNAEQTTRQMTHLGTGLGVALGGAMSLSMVKGYGRDREEEADRLGLQYMQKANYDPNAMVGVLKKFISIRDQLGITQNNYISKLINAEPGLAERLEKVEQALKAAK